LVLRSLNVITCYPALDHLTVLKCNTGNLSKNTSLERLPWQYFYLPISANHIRSRFHLRACRASNGRSEAS